MGGPGSGFFDHAGRPGLVGGSSGSGGGGAGVKAARDRAEKHARERRERERQYLDDSTQTVQDKMKVIADSLRDIPGETRKFVDQHTGEELTTFSGHEGDIVEIRTYPEDLYPRPLVEIPMHADFLSRLVGPKDSTSREHLNSPPNLEQFRNFLSGAANTLIVVTPNADYVIAIPPGLTMKDKLSIWRTMREIHADRIPDSRTFNTKISDFRESQPSTPPLNERDWKALAAKTKLRYKRVPK